MRGSTLADTVSSVGDTSGLLNLTIALRRTDCCLFYSLQLVSVRGPPDAIRIRSISEIVNTNENNETVESPFPASEASQYAKGILALLLAVGA